MAILKIGQIVETSHYDPGHPRHFKRIGRVHFVHKFSAGSIYAIEPIISPNETASCYEAFERNVRALSDEEALLISLEN